jgi:hypothetical protein
VAIQGWGERPSGPDLVALTTQAGVVADMLKAAADCVLSSPVSGWSGAVAILSRLDDIRDEIARIDKQKKSYKLPDSPAAKNVYNLLGSFCESGKLAC